MKLIYRLLTGSDDSEFCHKVSEALSKGWTLHGSPSMIFNSETKKPICCQAVVKVPEIEYQSDRPLSEQ